MKTKRTRKPYVRKRKKAYRKKKTTSLISWYPFDSTRIAKLRYSDVFSIDPATSVAGTYTFSANGLYDPNVTLVGHQPYGFDQLMLLYNHYTVIGSKITAYLVNPASSCCFGIKLSDANSLNTSTVEYIMEQPGFKKKMITHADQAEKTSISAKFSTYKFFRRSKSNIMADDALKGSSSGNPSEQAYYVVTLMPLVGGTDLPLHTIHVTIDYIAIFHGPRELIAS